MGIKMQRDELQVFLEKEFPQVSGDFTVEDVSEDGVRVRMHVSERNLRPGGTVSGPSIFALGDVAVYLAILANIGPEALAVTTNASVDFMHKPKANTDLIGKVRLLKLGRVLAVGDVLIYSDGMDAPVARASMTYSIPPKRA
ncbi:MAG: PaaI family thioesterase [Marinosulfonomonas sp.]|nr:PaaI family thioesterase [Marinosulfonomonas sp.]